MIRLIFIIVLTVVITSCGHQKPSDDYQYLKIKDYQDAVYASWIGQIIGNTYGLGYEFKFIEEPGPDVFPYGYGFTLEDLRQHNGAYSDDDTDIEYMYLTQMEKNGIEPSYYHLAEAWKTHVKERIWFANRMAVTLMHAGHYPPVTGHMDYNSEWFQIDPQLVNEIWAITAPGMIDYAVAKSEYAARITSDDFGLEPTLHYAAMFSAAFFEKDITKLIEIGNAALSSESRFAKAVNFVKEQYSKYPDNWQQARENVCDKYYVVEDYNRHSWAAVDATLNGTLGIMSLLYGQGDFQRTLDYACAFGMDADNQAATMCGLLGVVNGFASVPHELMFPLDDVSWEKPFNDTYKMITREGLDDAKITELAERTALQGEKIILSHGGEVIEKGGVKYYKIPVDAEFVAPFELNPIPDLALRVGQKFRYPLYTGGAKDNVVISINGEIPNGLVLNDVGLIGSLMKSGEYNFEVSVDNGEQAKNIDIRISVFEGNKALLAKEVFYNDNALDKNIEVIRDGDSKTSHLSLRDHNNQEVDYYGYKWEEEQQISTLIYNNGKPQEFYGWFTSFEVEYLKDDVWEKVENVNISPAMNLDNSQWLKPAYQDYTILFVPVSTKGIRIIGNSGGIDKDANNAHLGLQYATSIGELEVY